MSDEKNLTDEKFLESKSTALLLLQVPVVHRKGLGVKITGGNEHDKHNAALNPYSTDRRCRSIYPYDWRDVHDESDFSKKFSEFQKNFQGLSSSINELKNLEVVVPEVHYQVSEETGGSCSITDIYNCLDKISTPLNALLTLQKEMKRFAKAVEAIDKMPLIENCPHTPWKTMTTAQDELLNWKPRVYSFVPRMPSGRNWQLIGFYISDKINDTLPKLQSTIKRNKDIKVRKNDGTLMPLGDIDEKYVTNERYHIHNRVASEDFNNALVRMEEESPVYNFKNPVTGYSLSNSEHKHFVFATVPLQKRSNWTFFTSIWYIHPDPYYDKNKQPFYPHQQDTQPEEEDQDPPRVRRTADSRVEEWSSFEGTVLPRLR